jgi:hypothetical protein
VIAAKIITKPKVAKRKPAPGAAQVHGKQHFAGRWAVPKGQWAAKKPLHVGEGFGSFR